MYVEHFQKEEYETLTNTTEREDWEHKNFKCKHKLIY